MQELIQMDAAPCTDVTVLIESPLLSMLDKKPTFQTGEPIPESGIYRVIHKTHRVPHEVTLFNGQTFPRCSKCKDAVHFELIHAATELLHGQGFRVYLHELPAEDCECTGGPGCSEDKPLI
jgi:hypothetical protein